MYNHTSSNSSYIKKIHCRCMTLFSKFSIGLNERKPIKRYKISQEMIDHEQPESFAPSVLNNCQFGMRKLSKI